jgi:hypothetical protein
MKPLKLSILVTIIVITNNIAFSQTNKYDEAPKSPSFYFGLGTGINVNTGLTGIKLGARLNESTLVEASAGIGSWGNKFGLGVVLNAKNSASWCPVISISRATGIDKLSANLEFKNALGATNKRDIDITLNPATLFNISMQRQWIRPKGNRIVLELGYSILFAGSEYSVALNQGEKLSDASEKVMNSLKPGGIMIGFSYNFGIK